MIGDPIRCLLLSTCTLSTQLLAIVISARYGLLILSKAVTQIFHLIRYLLKLTKVMNHHKYNRTDYLISYLKV